MNKLLTVQEVAQLLNCKSNSIYAWAKSGELPAYKIKGLIRFDRAEIEAWIQSSKINPSASINRSSLFESRREPKKDIDRIVKNAIRAVKR